MATLGTLITNVRTSYLNETTASLWSDAELLVLAKNGVKDLWRGVLDLNGEHFQTVDPTNVSMAANTATLTGVPADVLRVRLIQPRDTTATSSSRSLKFFPRDYNSPQFIDALSRSAVDPTGPNRIYYSLSGAGGPVAAPTIYVAPQVNAAVLLRLVYIPTLAAADLESGDANPIPGEADAAVEAWIAAYALGKEVLDDGTVRPDPFWLNIYNTEKASILRVLDPRQEQEPKVVQGPFDDEQEDFY